MPESYDGTTADDHEGRPDRDSMKLYQKLLLGFACVALLVSAVGFVMQQTNQRVKRGVEQLSHTGVAEMTAAGELARSLSQSGSAVRRATFANSATEAQMAYQELTAALDGFDLALMAARSASTSSRRQAAEWGLSEVAEKQTAKLGWLDAIASDHNDLRALTRGLGERGLRSSAAARMLDAEIEPLLASMAQPLDQYRRAAQHDLMIGAADVRRSLTQADRFLFVAVLLGIGMTLVLGILISNSIAAPLHTLSEATRTLGRGRFDHRINLRSSREVTELAESLNRMAAELGETTVSKQYLDNILESMSDPLLVLNESGQIVLANAAVARILGYELEELHHISAGRLLADGESGVQDILELVEMWGATGNLEMNLLTHERAELPVVFTGAQMRDADGELQGVVCVAKDITQQKLVERELVKARERAEEMARLKSSFLANMSHEIRTPLTGIIGSAQVLTDVADGEALEMAETIERAGIRLLGTINSVLDMARIEAGELQPRIEPVKLVEEVRDSTGVLQRLATAKSIALEIAERAPNVWVAADPAFVHRIVTNLVGNAIKFTDAGKIVVEVDRDRDAMAVMRVRDTGVGIGAEFLPHLFEEFRQESSGFRRRHEGSGLGLAITKRLVDLLEGTIEVESAQGVGTTFTVRLPQADLDHAPRAETIAEVAAVRA